MGMNNMYQVLKTNVKNNVTQNKILKFTNFISKIIFRKRESIILFQTRPKPGLAQPYG